MLTIIFHSLFVVGIENKVPQSDNKKNRKKLNKLAYRL